MINITVGGVQYPVPSGPSDVNWAAKLAAFWKALATQANGAPLSWTSSGLSYASGWSGSLRYAKDGAGRVWWRGSATHSGVPTTIFNSLPAAILPVPTQTIFICGDQNNPATPIGLQIFSTGVVAPNTASTGVLIDFSQVFYDTNP